MAKKMTAKKKRAIIISAVLAALVIAGVLFGVLHKDEKIEVETVKVDTQTVNETLDTTGTVSAGSQEVFTIPNGVKVTSLNIKEGDKVKAGQIIATFDTTSLNETVAQRESAYEQAQAAYKKAQADSNGSGGKIAELKKQIAELEKEAARLESESKTTTTTTKVTTTAAKPEPTTTTAAPVKVSDSLVKRFMRISKVMGVEYSEDMARSILTGLLSSGSSTNQISSMLDNFSQLSSMGSFDMSSFDMSSFDMSSFAGMADTSGLLTAKANLIQLKSQLALLEAQSSDTYVSTFKTIADKAQEAYIAAQKQADAMKDGWKAAKDGVVTEVNITADGEPAGTGSAGAADFDISSILSAVTSGGDVTSMLSSFMSQGTAAVKVLYYPLVADIALSKYDVLDVELNQDAIIKTASNKLIDGKVSYISPVASSSNGLNIGAIMGSSAGSATTIPAQVTIDGADSSVIVGVDVNISIITDTKENATVIPVEAVCIKDEEVFVYVLEDGRAVKKNVELGINSDTYYEVISGVGMGDVLIKNTSGLEDGVKVVVK